MVKLIVGVKGTGKTKNLITLVNAALDKTQGSVLCMEKGTKLIHQVNYTARLVNTDDYMVCSAADLFGFVAGSIAANHDLTDLFIDSALKICNNDMQAFADFVTRVASLTEANNVNLVMTVSAADDTIPEDLRCYIMER